MPTVCADASGQGLDALERELLDGGNHRVDLRGGVGLRLQIVVGEVLRRGGDERGEGQLQFGGEVGLGMPVMASDRPWHRGLHPSGWRRGRR